MKTKKILLILLVATCLLFTVDSIVADEIQRTSEEIPIDHDASIGERGMEEPFILPEPSIEKQDYDGEIVGEDLSDDMPHILEVTNGDYDSTIALGVEESALGSDKIDEVKSIEIPIIFGVGLAAVLLLGLIFSKRR